MQNIRQIMTESGARPALEQVQALLHDDPDNAGLLLLKAELCLKADADDMADEVGSILLNLPPSDEREQLRALALKQAEAKIGKAQAIRRMDAERALGLLERAVSLCPFSPIIAFKSAEVLQASFAVNVPEQFRFGELVRQREKPWQGGDRSTSETYKRYLHVALEQAAPGDPAYRAAAERLAVWLLVEGDIGGALTVAERTLPRDGDEGQRFGQLLAALCFRELVGLVRGTVEQARAAVEIMTRCRNGIPRLPSVALLVAEARRRLGDLGGAERAYRQALRLADGEPARLRSWKTAGKALIQARGIVAPCKRCGGMMTPSQPKCEECGTKTSPQQFSGERAGLSNAPDAVFAHLGLAEVLDERGAIDQALQRLSLGLALLGNRQAIPRPVAEMHERLEYEHAQREALRALAAELKGAGPVTDAIVQHVWRLCDESPRIWTVIPPETRQRITEMLIDAGHLGLAGRLIAHILAETLPAAMVGALRGRLASAREQQADHRVEQARALLDGGHSEQAVQLAGQALELHRDHAGARLLRGRAAMRLGHYLLALDDFRAAMTDADEALADAARLEAARALERHGEWEGALALLESAPSAEAASIRERIDRRRSGTPVILSVAADGIVMHDTLQRAPSAAFHAMFGIALRMVGHLSAASQPGQYDHLLNAHFEFVQALGGLRHMPGDPLFALRMLSQPDPHISERGSLSITLMVRVTADSEAAARGLAGHMWPVVRDVLPSTQDHTYLFEPVVDEAELRYLLEPFADAEAAEVVRREYVPQQDGERYVVHPFLPGSINLHNLCWALLRQKAPAMVSVHLLPTDVMAWEHAALETALAGEPDSAADVGADDLALEPVLLRAASGSHWTAVVTNRHIADSLATQVYVVRLNVASSGAVSPLLSDVVASTLLGPVRQIGGGSLGGYAIVRPQTDAEMEIARRNLRLLDVEGWVYSAAPERASRIRHLAGEQEAAIVFRLPLPGPDGVPGLARLDVKPVAPPSRLPVNGVILGNSVTRGGDGPIRIRQNVADRRRHMYLVGKTGVGKSTLMENMILQDIEAG
ncbi:MAG: hypothetical protein IT323_05940, partial [Anaerolineae bacterium]|nr:hypothetical protein [Anaerolineae bacterium]